jgi:hypothetical protein
VLTSCCLHNMLCVEHAFKPDIESLQLSKVTLLHLDQLRKNSTRDAFQVTDKFRDYFNLISDSCSYCVIGTVHASFNTKGLCILTVCHVNIKNIFTVPKLMLKKLYSIRFFLN